MTTEQLKPCPHCGVELIPSGYNFNHPALNDCWLYNVKITPHEFESWNRRAPVQLSAQTAEPVAWIERRYANGDMVLETVKLQRMPEKERTELEQHYQLEVVSLYTDPPVIQTEQPSLSDAEIAQHFHEAYERLASSFGYETREASRKEWANVPANNKALMTAVVAEVRALLSAQRQDSDKLVVVHKFLLGEGPLDGFYFGDSDTRRPRPAFWWRNFLRAAIANGAPK